MKPRILAIPGADPSHWKWARVSSRNWQNTAALFLCLVSSSQTLLGPSLRSRVHVLCSLHRLQKGHDGQTTAGPAGSEWPRGAVTQGALRSPACRGWQLADLQLKPNECVRVSACDLFSLFCWEVSLQRAARKLVGLPRNWRSFRGPAFTAMRREVLSWHAGALSPAISGREPQGTEDGAAATQLYGSYRALAQRRSLRRGFCPTSSLESPPHCWGPSAVWDDIGRDVLV